MKLFDGFFRVAIPLSDKFSEELWNGSDLGS